MIKKITSESIVNPEIVYLDLDNTLYSYNACNESACKYLYKEISQRFSLDEGDVKRNYAEARSEVKKQLGLSASSHSRLLYLKKLMDKIGLNNQLVSVLELERIYWTEFFIHMKLREGVEEFLDSLRLKRIKIAIVTDLTLEIQIKKIIHLGLDQKIDYLFSSEEAGLDKPSKTMFEYTRKNSGSSKKTWFIGDDFEKDIEGSKKHLNSQTFMLTNKSISKNKSCDVVFDNFTDLIKLT